MQMNRYFEMIYILLDKKKCTANELAEHFEVSKRTILRDIDALSAAGIPIYTTKGKNGGVSLLDNYILNKALLTSEEQNEILYSLQSLKATQLHEFDKTLNRLSTIFQKADQNWIEVDFSRWGQGKNDNLRFETLKQSILNLNLIEFDYVSSYGEKTTRKVVPLKLIFKSKSWYLQGYCKNKKDYRIFKLNRMNNIKKLSEQFNRNEYVLPKFEESNNSTNSYIDIELAFSKEVAYRVYDEFDEGCIDQDDAGNLHVETCLPEDGWLYSFLLSFGKEVEIINPQHIKEKLNNLK